MCRKRQWLSALTEIGKCDVVRFDNFKNEREVQDKVFQAFSADFDTHREAVWQCDRINRICVINLTNRAIVSVDDYATNFVNSLLLEVVPRIVSFSAFIGPIAFLACPCGVRIAFSSLRHWWDLSRPQARHTDIHDVIGVVVNVRPQTKETFRQDQPQALILIWIVIQSRAGSTSRSNGTPGGSSGSDSVVRWAIVARR